MGTVPPGTSGRGGCDQGPAEGVPHVGQRAGSWRGHLPNTYPQGAAAASAGVGGATALPGHLLPYLRSHRPAGTEGGHWGHEHLGSGARRTPLRANKSLLRDENPGCGREKPGHGPGESRLQNPRISAQRSQDHPQAGPGALPTPTKHRWKELLPAEHEGHRSFSIPGTHQGSKSCLGGSLVPNLRSLTWGTRVHPACLPSRICAPSHPCCGALDKLLLPLSLSLPICT